MNRRRTPLGTQPPEGGGVDVVGGTDIDVGGGVDLDVDVDGVVDGVDNVDHGGGVDADEPSEPFSVERSAKIGLEPSAPFRPEPSAAFEPSSPFRPEPSAAFEPSSPFSVELSVQYGVEVISPFAEPSQPFDVELLAMVSDERKVIELEADEPRVIEIEADEPSGPIDPPLPFEMQRLGTQPPSFEVTADEQAFARGTQVSAHAHAPAPELAHSVGAQFAAGTQPDAPALSTRESNRDIASTPAPSTSAPSASNAAPSSVSSSPSPIHEAPTARFARARTGGGRVAAIEPAKVASGTIEPTDVVPKIDPDEEHAVIVQLDDAWLERLDLPPE